MRVCAECFASIQLKELILRGALHDCSYCAHQNVPTVDPRELLLHIEPFFELYQPGEAGLQIGERLVTDFPSTLLTTSDGPAAQGIVEGILGDSASDYGWVLAGQLVLRSEGEEYQEQVSALMVNWELFCEEIKSTNRFHLDNRPDSTRLSALLSAIQVKITKGKIFYRARLSNQNGYAVDEMWNPRSDLATAGRANPVGISYLYLADDVETTIFEVRAGLYDYATIGQFRLLEDIYVVDLKDVDKQDPIAIAEREVLDEYVAFRSFLRRLGEELSTPNRRTDSELDYIPTQYLAEFIKSKDFDGIGYGSSLNVTGHNYAIFHPAKFECFDVKVHEIDHIELTHQEIG